MILSNIKGKKIFIGVSLCFHRKLIVYYIRDYFGILFILDINSVLKEFVLWDQRLLKDCFVKNSEGLRYC